MLGMTAQVTLCKRFGALSQGTKQIKRLEENVGGFELSQRISKADLDELSSFFHMDAAVGERWAQTLPCNLMRYGVIAVGCASLHVAKRMWCAAVLCTG